MDEPVSADLTELNNSLNALKTLADSLPNIRAAPGPLLQPPSRYHQVLLFASQNRVKESFHALSHFADRLQQSPVQTALQRSSERIQHAPVAPSDETEQQLQNVHQLFSQNPTLPAHVLKSTDVETGVLEQALPSLLPSTKPMSIGNLKDYLLSRNKSSKIERRSSVRIWRSTRPSDPSDEMLGQEPIVLRMVLQDALVVFIILDINDNDPTTNQALIVESLNAFGCRETAIPHSYSEYTVFQKLTQYLTGIINAHPSCSLQSILALLDSYQFLFLNNCIACDRVASEDGHIPAVARSWRAVDAKSAVPSLTNTIDGLQEGEWLSRHINCLDA